MNPLIKTYVCMILLITNVSMGEDEKSSALKFGDYLHYEGDYYRAITEYKRLMFLDHANENRSAIRQRIAMSYFRGHKYEPAKRIFREISLEAKNKSLIKKSMTMLAACYYETGDYEMTVSTLENIAPDDKDTLPLKMGWCHLMNGNPKEAIDTLSKIRDTSKQKTESVILIQKAEYYDELPEKSPATAGTLSAFLPGAGQAYNGKYRDALTSFILNGLFLWGTIEAFDNDENVAGAFGAIISSGWYAGNVYNAASGSHKRNRDVRKQFLYKVKVTCGISIADEEDMSFVPILGVKAGF
ncbi:MAG: tetratricopeptide repeat protein [Kiritimatiellia bacterium]|nr:tetratricopeptide repeat protein [Kiritimatiellia bacterium]